MPKIGACIICTHCYHHKSSNENYYKCTVYDNHIRNQLEEVRLCKSFRDKRKEGMTSRYVTLQVDLMEELASITIYNEKFDGNQWSLRDAEILECAAKMIREDIGRVKTEKDRTKKGKRKIMP